MHNFRSHRLSWAGICLSLACSNTGLPLETRRSPVAEQDAAPTSSAISEEAIDTSSDTNATASEEAIDTSSDTNADALDVGSSDVTASDVTSPSAPGHWTLVRREDSEQAFAEEWTYDEAARLVKARVLHVRRDINPYYAVDITITRAGDRVTSVHDRQPEDLLDVTYDFQLEAGNVVAYTALADDQIIADQAFEYDAERRLIASRETYPGGETIWTLERNERGEPGRLLHDGEVACVYSWRLGWHGTTCYSDGVVSQIYEAVGERLTRMTYVGSSVVDYTYDDKGHLTSRTSGPNVNEFRYSADAKLLEVRGPGYEEVRAYDDLGLLREVRWTDATSTVVNSFTYERVADDEVIETESSAQRTVVRTFKRLPHAPEGEPQVPEFWTILRMVQPDVYIAPTDYSKVP